MSSRRRVYSSSSSSSSSDIEISSEEDDGEDYTGVLDIGTGFKMEFASNKTTGSLFKYLANVSEMIHMLLSDDNIIILTFQEHQLTESMISPITLLNYEVTISDYIQEQAAYKWRHRDDDSKGKIYIKVSFTSKELLTSLCSSSKDESLKIEKIKGIAGIKFTVGRSGTSNVINTSTENSTLDIYNGIMNEERYDYIVTFKISQLLTAIKNVGKYSNSSINMTYGNRWATITTQSGHSFGTMSLGRERLEQDIELGNLNLYVSQIKSLKHLSAVMNSGVMIMYISKEDEYMYEDLKSVLIITSVADNGICKISLRSH